MAFVWIFLNVNLSLNQTLLTFWFYLKHTWITQFILAISVTGYLPLIQKYSITHTVIHLMHVIACTHASTCTTSLMCVKKTCTSVYHTCLGHWNEENERIKTSNRIVDHFSLTFVKLLLTWMLYFHIWLQNKRKILI